MKLLVLMCKEKPFTHQRDVTIKQRALFREVCVCLDTDPTLGHNIGAGEPRIGRIVIMNDNGAAHQGIMTKYRQVGIHRLEFIVGTVCKVTKLSADVTALVFVHCSCCFCCEI